jgi:hypothetical protein
MRKLLISILVVFMLSIGTSVMAQDECGGLGEDDCAILGASNEAMTALDAARFASTFDLTLSGEGQSIMLGLTVDGAFSGITGIDVTALDTADTTALFPALGDLISAFDAELFIGLNIPAELAGEIPAEFSGLDLWLVDGVGYLDFSQIIPLLGPDGAALTSLGIPNGPAGLDFVDTLTNLGMFLGDSMGDLGGDLGMDMGDDSMVPELDFAQYATITRGDDVDGNAVFVYDIDFAALAADEEFLGLLETSLEAQGGVTGQDLGDTEQALALLTTVADGSTFTLTQQIDLETNYTELVLVNFTLSPEALQQLDPNAPALDVVFNFVITISEFDSATVAAPDGAPVVGFMELFGLLSSGGGF